MQVRPVVAIAAIVFAGAGGWLVHRPSVVASAASNSSDPRMFQMQGNGPSAVLTVYEPSQKRFYVYHGVGAGSNTVYCAYSLELEHPGGPLDRKNCQIGSVR